MHAELIKAHSERVRTWVGRPYREGAAGPEAFDCWGLFRAAQRELFGREIAVAGDSTRALKGIMRLIGQEAESARWRPIESPAHGDAVTLTHSRHPHHIGTWLGLDRGGVLHAVKGPGVVFQTLPALAASGWLRIVFYRFEGDA